MRETESRRAEWARWCVVLPGLAQISRSFLGETKRESTAHLLEANSIGLLAEALTAEVEAVLADETSLVSTVAAKKDNHFVSFPMSLEHAEGGRYSPLAGALTELAGAREPDGVVCHLCRR